MPQAQDKTFGPLRLLVLFGLALVIISVLVFGEVRKYNDRDTVTKVIREQGGAVLLGEPTTEPSRWQLRYWVQQFVEDHHVSAVRLVQYQLRNEEDLHRLLTLEEMSDLTLVGELDTSLVCELQKLRLLETLTLRSVNIDAKVIDGLKNLPTLKHLYVEDCSLTVPVLRALADLSLELSLSLADQSLSDEFLVALSKCDNLHRLQFDRCVLDNERIQLLQGSNTTTQLSLNDTQVTTSGLASLLEANKRWTIELQSLNAPRRDSTAPNRFPSKKEIGNQSRLDFAGPCIDDALFDCIAMAQNLSSLGLGNCSITDAGLDRLMAFADLKQLSIASARLTDEGLRSVERLSKLEYLFLNVSSIRGESFDSLPASIKSLTLRSLLIEPPSLSKLANLTSLQELTLEGSNFTDQSLNSIPSFPLLENLTLYETSITEQGLANFKLRFPTCKITNN